MTIGLLPDNRTIGPAAGRHETPDPLRSNALDPGFHWVPTVRSRRTMMLMVSA
jgi:hypothetical protein